MRNHYTRARAQLRNIILNASVHPKYGNAVRGLTLSAGVALVLVEITVNKMTKLASENWPRVK